LGNRVVDFLLAVFLLIILSPLILVAIILISLDSKGWVWLRLKRIGKNGKEFFIYKLRTMYPDSKEITRIGKYLRRSGIDELPQLINVIKGEMSLVGPRPEVPEIVRGYSCRERERLEVIPGLTGLWQISPYRGEPIHHHLEYDLEYINKATPLYDLKIIAKTICWFLKKLILR
jgi:lipopolysaccharide/colanic/teichoic acid biosynthesis glycosyltransferase